MLAYVSAQDLTAGEHELPLRLVLPERCAPSGVEPAQVKVTIKELVAAGGNNNFPECKLFCISFRAAYQDSLNYLGNIG